MTADPYKRSEDVTMPYYPTRPTPPSTPAVRDQQVDWLALTEEERLAVREWEMGLAPLEILPTKARVYVGRHVVRES